MRRSHLEVADIFCAYGAQYRRMHRGHLSLGQLKVMSAIERCRTTALGGHRLHCDTCGADTIAYNSCRNRHCPKCQATAAERWLERQQADLLPVPYFHVVFTLPESLRQIAYQNPRVIYDLLFKCVSQTLLTIAGDKKHLGATPAITAVLHTWGSNLCFHPHIHCILTGGGLRPADSPHQPQQWIACRRRFFLPVKVLSRHFRQRFLTVLHQAYARGELNFFGDLKDLENPDWFDEHLKPLRNTEWIVYAKAPFAGPQAVLTYLSRYTHRVAISNRRLLRLRANGVTFRYKDYRNGNTRWRSMTVATDEFIRRFLLHILPKGLHRIRHYGLLANARRKENLGRARSLLSARGETCAAKIEHDNETNDEVRCAFTCWACGEPLIIVEILTPRHAPRAPPQTIAA